MLRALLQLLLLAAQANLLDHENGVIAHDAVLRVLHHDLCLAGGHWILLSQVGKHSVVEADVVSLQMRVGLVPCQVDAEARELFEALGLPALRSSLLVHLIGHIVQEVIAVVVDRLVLCLVARARQLADSRSQVKLHPRRAVAADSLNARLRGHCDDMGLHLTILLHSLANSGQLSSWVVERQIFGRAVHHRCLMPNRDLLRNLNCGRLHLVVRAFRLLAVLCQPVDRF